MLDSGFDYENYIQKRLKEIDDLDERRFAKELLTESLGKVLKYWNLQPSFFGIML